MHKAVLAWDTGKAKCGDEHYALSKYLKFAARIMANVPVDDAERGCETVEFATEIADYADCICNVCDCPQPAVDCTLVADFTVLDAIAYGDLPVSPNEGDAYYILSGTPVGQILTSISSVWVPTLVPPNSIVWSVDDNAYYTNTVYFSPPGPGLLFSTPILTLVSGTTWNLTLSDPQTATNRVIQLQALGPNGWYAIAPATTEDALPQGVNLLGLPVQNIRLNYQIQDELCWYYSGTGEFIPPVVPPDPCTNIPSFGVIAAVDASAQGTPSVSAPGAYLIASDDFSIGNTWASHVNEIVNEDGSFTPLTATDIVYAQDTGIYWRFIAGGMAHLFPAMRVTQTLVPSGYFLESDWISASAAGNRFVMVEARNGPDLVNDWIIAWMGYEYDLPQQIVDLGEFLGLRTTYTVNGCTYVIPGTVVIPDIFTVDLDCTEIVYMTYRYSDAPAAQQAFRFQALPGNTVTLTFIQGQMDPSDVIRGYSGTDSSGTPIPGLTGTFADFSVGLVAGTSDFEYLYLEVDSTQVMPDDLATWLFQAVCTQGTVVPAGFATITDSCETYSFTIDVMIDFTGDEPTCGIEYTVDGAPQTPITGLVDFDVQQLGPFPYNAVVGVTLTHATNPLSNVLLGYFTNNGDCPVTSDPCLPEGASKLDDIGDLADLPDPAPYDGFSFLVVSDFSALGTWPVGELLTWDNGTMTYSPTSYLPGLYYTEVPFQYWQTNGPGTQPYPLYPVPHMRPTGDSPNNWRIVAPDILNYSIPLNTPMALEVRSGFGPWTQVLTVTLQQLIVLYYFPITQPFTEARIVWDYDTCGIIGGVIIET